MSKQKVDPFIQPEKVFLDDRNNPVGVGEVWFDRAGNECFYRPNGTLSCRTVNDEPSMTIQSEKDSCDFNKIYEKYSKTRLMTNLRIDPPQYGDFSSAVDYHETLFRAQQAYDTFMELPANVRSRFQNDPGQLIDFLQDQNNRDEAVKLGLLNKSENLVNKDTKSEDVPKVSKNQTEGQASV